MPTLSLTVTAEQASRISQAVGVSKGLGRAANLGEVRDYLVNVLRQLVRDVELQVAIQAVPPPLDLGDVI